MCTLRRREVLTVWMKVNVLKLRNIDDIPYWVQHVDYVYVRYKTFVYNVVCRTKFYKVCNTCILHNSWSNKYRAKSIKEER